jgi:hypothetical protein
LDLLALVAVGGAGAEGFAFLAGRFFIAAGAGDARAHAGAECAMTACALGFEFPGVVVTGKVPARLVVPVARDDGFGSPAAPYPEDDRGQAQEQRGDGRGVAQDEEEAFHDCWIVRHSSHGVIEAMDGWRAVLFQNATHVDELLIGWHRGADKQPEVISMRLPGLMALVAAVIGVAGCAHSARKAVSSASPAGGRFDGENPVIVRVVGRNEALTISSGARGVAYSVKGVDGRAMLSRGTLEDLRRVDPVLYRQVNSGLAAAEEGSPMLDASADVDFLMMARD